MAGDGSSVASKRRRLGAAMALALTAAAATAALCLAMPYVEGHAGASEADRFKAEPAQGAAPYAEGPAEPATAAVAWPEIDWEGLLAQNGDAAAWITIPGTRVDYPVMQADADWPEFYLSHGVDGRTSRYGCPYIDCEMADAGGVDAPLVVIYGHHLVNGEMFSDLARYSEAAYAEEHSQILLMTPEGNRELEVVAVDVVDASKEAWRTTFSGRADFESYAEGLVEGADAALPGGREGAGRLYLLVTCSYGSSNERTVVMAADASPDAPEPSFPQPRFTALG